MSSWVGPVIGVIVGSSLFAAFATNWQGARFKRKEIVAAATKSALRRVEMFYRLRRRHAKGEDDTALRELFHDIQEENDHYQALLDIESVWLGKSYRRFLAALRYELAPFIDEALVANPLGPLGQFKDEKRPDVDKYVRQFAKDSRRFFNPLMRPLMRLRHSFPLNKFFKENQYGS